RRHTRSYGDWSSDVCSSDLAASSHSAPRSPSAGSHTARSSSCSTPFCSGDKRRRPDREQGKRQGKDGSLLSSVFPVSASSARRRSEERRVGKEGGARCVAVC